MYNKIGIVFGCYAPLHQGHLDVIFRAKKECDKVFLFVCGCEGSDDRGGKRLPLEKRTRLIKYFFKDDEIITVLQTNDTELGIDESGSESNWDKWVDYTKREVCKQLKIFYNKNVDYGFLWYIAEPDYKTKLNNRGERTILCERINPISGTECREHPLKNWSKITKEFRPYYNKNILIIGSASEGKTTLCQDLGKYFNCPVSWEKGRDRIIDTEKNETQLNVNDFVYNIYEQNKLNESLIHQSENGIFISDTDNLVTLMYAKEYVDRHLGNLSVTDYKEVLIPLVRSYKKRIWWDKIFIIKPTDKPYVNDGVRDFSYGSDDDRLEFFNTLCSLCKDYGYQYEVVEGNYYHNFITIKEYIERLLKDE